MRMTKQRSVILNELRRSDLHPTADEIYQAVRKKLPRISLGTVYRNLDMLAREGLIHRIHQAGSQMRFDAHAGDHIHIRCAYCGRIHDIKRRHGCEPWESSDIEESG